MSRLLMALLVAAFAVFSYFSSSEQNPITGDVQYLSMTAEQEIALGLQAAPSMIRQYGGLADDGARPQRVDAIGTRLVENSVAQQAGWEYDFHVLDDEQTVNAFALPGGQVFITRALLDKLTADDQVAGILAHEIGHVLARHGAQRLAKQQLAQGLTAAAVLATSDDNAGRMAALIGNMVNMKYGREDELQADTLGVRLMHQAGYNPEALIQVMQILDSLHSSARPPEFFSTHPNPENRIKHIEDAIRQLGQTPAEP